ncbi:hypothetical protein [uncultured Phocaeicola sp.]|uniref:hypothetical protein n=1 Tax=uncultured Phocaeicola sp. TaxID=990718 RepID=UPI002599EDE8|nr:hypothetical protein [uncultured Phocaeicola sp.]
MNFIQTVQIPSLFAIFFVKLKMLLEAYNNKRIMLGGIIILAVLGYLIWKKTEKVKADTLPVAARRLCYLPIVQFVFCAFFCLISFAFDGNLPKDEINEFIEEYEFVGDLSSALLGLDLTADQVTMYILTENLHSKATYILIGSFIMMLIQIVGASKTKLDKLVIEVIAAVHTICIFYIGNLLGEAFYFMLSQIGTIKILSAISEDTSSSMYGIVAIWFVPFHYLYHYVLEKYYAQSVQENEISE